MGIVGFWSETHKKDYQKRMFACKLVIHFAMRQQIAAPVRQRLWSEMISMPINLTIMPFFFSILLCIEVAATLILFINNATRLFDSTWQMSAVTLRVHTQSLCRIFIAENKRKKKAIWTVFIEESIAVSCEMVSWLHGLFSFQRFSIRKALHRVSLSWLANA